MQQAAKSLSVVTPPQIRAGGDRSFGGLSKQIRQADRQSTPQYARQGHLMDGKRRLAGPSPSPLVRISKQGIAHLRKPRALIYAIFIGQLYRSERHFPHHASCNEPLATWGLNCLL